MLRAPLTDVGLFASMPRYGDMAIHAVIDVRRSFARAELERAVAAALDAFPVLGSRYQPGVFRDRWVRVDAPISQLVHVAAAPADLSAETQAWIRRPIDVTRERPLRLVSLPRDGGSRLLLSVMHLAVDGAGVGAVGHVLGASLYGTSPSVPIDPRRGLWSVLDRVRWAHAPVVARDLWSAMVQPIRSMRAAKRQRHYPADASAEARYRHVAIPAERLAALRARCPQGNPSVNDLLVAALARAVAARSSDGPALVVYSMDLRRFREAPRLSAANTSTLLTVVVPREHLHDLPAAAGAVARITADHRRTFAGPASVLAPLTLGVGSPHAVVREVAKLIHEIVVEMPMRRGLLVTNVGRIDQGLAPFGDDVEAIRIVGPNIAGVRVPAVVAYGFRGALHLTLVAAPGVSTAALEELEHEIADALELPREPCRGAATTQRSDRPSQHER